MKKKDQVIQNREQLVNLLVSKASLKQDIADDCEKVFVMLKDAIKKELLGLQEKITDKRVRLSYKEKGNYEIHVFVGSDVLVFSLHNNVFRLPDENPLWGTAYFQADSDHGYFGIINIYNFLAESFIQNRLDDIGYLIARIKINKERHFMLEGNGQLGSLFRDPRMKQQVILLLQLRCGQSPSRALVYLKWLKLWRDLLLQTSQLLRTHLVDNQGRLGIQRLALQQLLQVPSGLRRAVE